MKCKRVELLADVQKYNPNQGLEDGFELWSDVITREWIVTDFLVKITLENEDIVCPYIRTRRGKEFIGVNDYIVLDEDGTKHVCGGDKIWNRYIPLE